MYTGYTQILSHNATLTEVLTYFISTSRKGDSMTIILERRPKTAALPHIEIDPETHRRLKVLRAETNIPIYRLATQAIDIYLNQVRVADLIQEATCKTT